jgi:integrase
MRGVVMLAEMKIRAAKVPNGKKQIKLTDGGGLYLLVKPAGKYWRFDYRYAGKRKTLALGIYPDVKTKRARQLRDEAREQLANGIDPQKLKRQRDEQIRAESVALTFEGIAREWFRTYRKDLSENYADKVIRSLEINVFPWLGSIPIKEIEASQVLLTLQRVADRGAEETARRIKTLCSAVFCYAVLHHGLQQDPTTVIKGFLKNKKKKHYACITDSKEAGQLMRDISNFEGTFIVQTALKLTPYVFLRPGELRSLEWTEIDFTKKQIKLAAEKMKMKQTHIVPLSKQALSLLEDIYQMTGRGKYVFPSIRTNLRPISNNTINVALRRLGYDKETMCAHGFRAMASTLLHEQGFNSDYIERQLAHKEGNAIKAAYNHARHLPERFEMMQAWADYLDGLREGAEIIPIGKKRANGSS